jgi:hypothetical protein
LWVDGGFTGVDFATWVLAEHGQLRACLKKQKVQS